MSAIKTKKQARLKRKKSIRKRLNGTAERPRLTVFRSSKHIYAQIVDDGRKHTLVSASSSDQRVREFIQAGDSPKKISIAHFVGKLVADRALEKGIKKVVFDRNGFLYHGRVKAISDGAREAGLDF
jgi:large subunit ribosomal protein L18